MFLFLKICITFIFSTVGSWSDWVYTVRKSTGSWAVAKAGDLCPGSVVDVECQLADGSPAKLAGQVIHCKERIGVYCRNSEQLGNDPVCADFRFRFLCADIEKPRKSFVLFSSHLHGKKKRTVYVFLWIV